MDNHIYMNNEENIIQELVNKKEWIESMTQLVKFPKSNTLKITFDETAKTLDDALWEYQNMK